MNVSNWHTKIRGSNSTPLVCVHGWGCNNTQFDRLSGLLETEFRIYQPDLPGHGQTPLGGFEPGFDTYAAALAGWIAATIPEPAILVGHSMGGALSLMVAGLIPVRAVINLDGSLPAKASTLAAQATIRGWLDEPGFRERLANVLREGFFLPSERDAEAEEVIRTMCSAPEAVLRFLPEKIGTLDAPRILAKVSAPVLYVGAENPRYDEEQARQLVPHLQLAQIRNTGHFLHMRAPEQVARLARAFLNPTSKAE